MKYLISTFLLFCFLITTIKAQVEPNNKLIQFSGMVLDGSDTELYPVPFTNIYIKNKGRGTYSDFKGFFSIVVEKGDSVGFSAVGYKNVEIVIPDTLNDSRYSLIQLMSQDTFTLPTTIVFPWPSKDHFKLEFLAMDVSKEMQQRAIENLAQETLTRGREIVLMDGNEHADFYLRQQSKQYYYVGQTPPMNIFNPISWKKFFDSWQNGDFKKKKESEKDQ
jgi:carboxypeptidase-like protein